MNQHELMAGAIRALSMDAVQAANSGHPGAPMGMADMASVLWQKHITLNPANPKWDNRDRFVLSNGHASMLQYSLLHLSGFDLSLDDLKAFRQMHSKTPGHPEVHETPGVETTTGPLGQGIANAVGFALAEAHLAAQYNREGYSIVDHHTYCLLGDGCLMEGISHEACSLAGTLGLGKLIALYDANGISIDGEVAPWFGEDVAKRFEAYGWQVISDVDGHDPQAIDAAINQAKANTDQPSLIICHTVIGYGSPNLAGSEKSHGAPLGEEEIGLVKDIMGLPNKAFALPEGVYEAASLKDQGAAAEKNWQQLFDDYAAAHPALAAQYQRVMSGELPEQLDDVVAKSLQDLQDGGDKVATRKASEQALNLLAGHLPELFGGSADLSGSNNTWSKHSTSIKPHDFAGNYVHYGVREFAMAAIMNGLYLHGGIRPYGGTFLVFSDYMRNAMRLSALMKLPVTYVLTHDSIGLGEDGPTHQPVEHVSSLRLIPNLDVWRPCDGVETLVAWRAALNPSSPTALALSRQGLPMQARTSEQFDSIYNGAYVLSADDAPEIVLLASGSEVELVVQAAKTLREQSRRVQVVSVPCYDVFMRQSADYRESVVPAHIPALAVEAGSGALWRALVGTQGDVISMDEFGASAPAGELFAHYGFDVETVVQRADGLLK
ncbi:transketolase [Suttonella sp. R2A3]|uniref:transketolase n=1 Tax=Suttonella sp. R2A3 TaxID=2908648 RepID=UPI001F024943|nr:transketolase [Suttonella sp. R2A3]UJF25170.1 transketolase [Suttonella sp. R2A3]